MHFWPLVFQILIWIHSKQTFVFNFTEEKSIKNTEVYIMQNTMVRGGGPLGEKKSRVREKMKKGERKKGGKGLKMNIFGL